MRLVCLLALVSAAAVVAAPVPKPDPELERIAKAFGTVAERQDCTLGMDGKGVLTLKMEKARPPKPAPPDAAKGGSAVALPEPTGVAFVRALKGEFTATAEFRLTTDLTARPGDAGGLSVGLWAEYPAGVSASIDRSFSVGTALNAKKKVVAAGTGSHTADGTPAGFRGKGMGGPLPSGEGTLRLRVRCTGQKLVLEHQPDGTAWEAFDELVIKAAGEGTVKLAVKNYHGAACEVVVEKFDVK